MKTIPLKTPDEIRSHMFSGKTYIALTLSGPFSASLRAANRIYNPIDDMDYDTLREKVKKATGLVLPPFSSLGWTVSCGIGFSYVAARLSAGDRVWDDGAKGWAVIKDINYGPKDPHANLVVDRWCREENAYLYDEENITEDTLSWRQNNLNKILLYIPGLVGPDGHPLCREHRRAKRMFQYFSPSLDDVIPEDQVQNTGKA